MTLARPKRKAASNKNYLDTGAEFLDEVVPSVARRKRPSAASTPKLALPGAARVPYNWQPPVLAHEVFSHKLNLTNAYVDAEAQTLTCPEHAEAVADAPDDEVRELQRMIRAQLGQKADSARRRTKSPHFQLRKGDFIYMVSEPPGEPYYIGRVMGFTRKAKGDDAAAYVFQIQWFYRPRDISKNTLDLRLLFASMHSDTCPLSSFRGVVTVKHKLDVERCYPPPPEYSSAVEYYLLFPNCFYFDKLFDRYMIKFYDILKTLSLLQYVDNAANNSRNYLLALNKRFEFIFMEASRTKQFVNNFHSTLSSHCDVCAEWCAQNESVTCAGCEKHFHMLCLDPPLLRKPSRGFSWSCALCTKKHELEHRSKRILMLSHDNRLSNEHEISDAAESLSSQEDSHTAPEDLDSPEAEKRPADEVMLPKYELMAAEYLKNDADVLVEARRLREEWSLRYLGTHVRLEDAVDPDDRSPYPRASTSLGTRYQATNIPEFEGHPIVYYDIDKSGDSSKSKKGPGGRKVVKKKQEEEEVRKLPVPKEYQDVPPKQFPDWLQPRPKGYIERGVDDGEGETCSLMWKPREEDEQDNFGKLDDYLKKCETIAKGLDLHHNSPNFVDAILKLYYDFNGDVEAAFAAASKLTRQTLKEPTFSKEEIKRFEAGVKRYGSELFPTYKEVKTQSCAMVVRYYYLWKKTKRGRAIWGNYFGRKKKKDGKDKENEMKIKPEVDDYADTDDDSSYENDKIIAKSKLFRCKHCRSYESREWFKITGYDGTTKYDENTAADDVDPDTVTALCFRCAKLWRRYAVYWEDPAEVERKNARGIGGYKKKIESELVFDSETILKHASTHGGSLSYDSNKQSVKCSVLSQQNISNGLARKAPSAPKSTKPTVKAATKVATPVKQSSKSKTTTLETTRLTSRQLSLSTKQEAKAEPVEPVKRRKVEAPKEPKVTQPKAAPETKKRPAAAKSVESASKKKKKAPGKVKAEPKSVEPEEPKEEAQSSISNRRQKKPSDGAAIVSPIFNPSYRHNLPEIATVPKIDKKHLSHLTKEVFQSIVENYKYRQLTDMKLVILGIQVPHNVKLELPFNLHERNCCICLEHDEKEESLLEMLICSNCGVNVHASCAGLSISGKQKPVKQWLCLACTDNLCPNYSLQYSCSLCLAKDCSEGLAILGASLAKPDYLVPILETGKWCHLICALYAYKQVEFRNVLVPSFVAKDVLSSTLTRGPQTAVESVSRVFVNNYSSNCGICKSFNGALIECDACGADGQQFHVICAQDTPNFKLGFKIVPQKVSKANTNTYVGDTCGKLEPILLCPRHDQRGRILSMRESGKRTSSGEARPLITLFIEDLSRLTNAKLTGPQLRAHNYISAIEKFMETERKIANKQVDSKPVYSVAKRCEYCKILSSPKWWKTKPQDANGHANGTVEEAYACRNCHLLGRDGHVQSEKPEGDAFADELNEPLDGTLFGIRDPHDHIANVYKPVERKALSVERSKITLGDLLT